MQFYKQQLRGDRGDCEKMRERPRASSVLVIDALPFFAVETQGYSNPLEVNQVVEQARSALLRYGSRVDVRVISFYNMQKRELERDFQRHSDISHIPICSVRETIFIVVAKHVR